LYREGHLSMEKLISKNVDQSFYENTCMNA